MNHLRYVKSHGYSISFGYIHEMALGVCYIADKEIRINAIANIYDTFLHECYHARYPKLSERKIRRLAYKERRRTSRKKMRRIVLHLLKTYAKEGI